MNFEVSCYLRIRFGGGAIEAETTFESELLFS